MELKSPLQVLLGCICRLRLKVGYIGVLNSRSIANRSNVAYYTDMVDRITQYREENNLTEETDALEGRDGSPTGRPSPPPAPSTTPMKPRSKRPSEVNSKDDASPNKIPIRLKTGKLDTISMRKIAGFFGTACPTCKAAGKKANQCPPEKKDNAKGCLVWQCEGVRVRLGRRQ
ncbi:uncharacterized protein BCR38DRAFT_167096 [Pseudomassariella vexata]|uniref:Uncharacterized protein n=1 Tax=Pseudomassariella vexata TaxID=1141098 RepID=A0A1Y2E392_9PEZI|nr:uncharacterized protein BCR38DRAFT_167096 [Pseudomassariella vexata]ORY65834.1 hypothetical protein BCR38DRAFT_167096 [Pseudomassariella vexata]